MSRSSIWILKVFQFLFGKLARDIMPANRDAWHMNREFARHKLTWLKFIHARPYLMFWVAVEYIWDEKDGQYGNITFFSLQRTVAQREASARLILKEAERMARLAIQGVIEPSHVEAIDSLQKIVSGVG